MQLSPSAGLHSPSPHVGQAPQSIAQLAHVSPSIGLHTPSPHRGGGHGPQSVRQLAHVSPSIGAHSPSPQPGRHSPQSSTQLSQLSPSIGLHSPSPQPGRHSPQSIAQLSHVSRRGSQVPSPHVLQRPQSSGHVAQDSPAPQTPSPHSIVHRPQSAGQLSHDSPPWHTASPHDGAPASIPCTAGSSEVRDPQLAARSVSAATRAWRYGARVMAAITIVDPRARREEPADGRVRGLRSDARPRRSRRRGRAPPRGPRRS